MVSEEKTGTIEELHADMKQCGFHKADDVPLEVKMSQVRLQVDDMFQRMLVESELPLYLFDYVVMSVLADIRKADADTARLSNYQCIKAGVDNGRSTEVRDNTSVY
jgi:hypothetical protein